MAFSSIHSITVSAAAVKLFVRVLFKTQLTLLYLVCLKDNKPAFK